MRLAKVKWKNPYKISIGTLMLSGTLSNKIKLHQDTGKVIQINGRTSEELPKQ